MRKMTSFKNLMWVCAVAVLGACSSNETVELTPESPQGFDEEGNGYINISINMPGGGGSGTRANDVTDDGSEYNIDKNKMALILFGNDTQNETNATCQAALPLSGLTETPDLDNDQISWQGYKTQKIKGLNSTYKYAVVVLNYGNLFTLDNDKQQLKFGDKVFTGTFTEFSQQLVKAASSSTTNTKPEEDTFIYKDGTTKYFFMTNAVLSKQTGGSSSTAPSSTITMTEITNKIYKTETAAQNGDVVNIVVERGVAKVQLAAPTEMQTLTNVSVEGLTSTSTKEEKENSGYQLTATNQNVSWALKNKNSVSYLVRNWNQAPYTDSKNTYNMDLTTYGDAWLGLHSDGDGTKPTTGPLVTPTTSDANKKYNAYRFAGYTPIQITTPDYTAGVDPIQSENVYYYRTYWGVDPNYNEALAGATTGKVDETDYTSLSETGGDTKYCFENTFDIKHQTQENTTEAMIKVQFQLPSGKNTTTNGGEGDYTFYTLNNNSKTVYNITDLSKVIAKSSSITKVAGYTSGSSIVTITYGKAGGTATSVTPSTTAGNITGVIDDNTLKGQIVITSLQLTGLTTTGTGAATSATKTFTAEELKALNNEYTINRYYKGEAYYPVLIKHFGDDLTPWNEDTKTNGNAYVSGSTKAGETPEDRWLGRYGVLRNNWYLLNITTISNIGYPTEPTPDNTTDDEVESWINVRVSMLSWAKRQQDIKL